MIACLARRGFYLCLAVGGLLCIVSLAGCSPQYNWREWIAEDGAVRAFFPARPQTEQRIVSLPEAELDYRMTVATVNDAMFAVAQAALPASDRGDLERAATIARAVGRSVYASLQATPPDPLPVDGTVMTIRGQGTRSGTWATLRLWATPRAVIEAIALGRTADLPAEQAQQFVSQVVVSAAIPGAARP
ncbi:MAG: hypothetical protein JHC61_06985 [Burkholderiaceae bacterium]|nr:hypothetical protein [Burkholderiaceae bacterium]